MHTEHFFSFGPDAPVFLIAEAGVNHDGDPARARRLIDAAADAGADAVKFQTFRAEKLASKDAPKANYQLAGTPERESQWEMLKRLELPAEAYPELKQHAQRRGLIFLSTPFDEETADFLEGLDVPAFKIPSGEITNLPFLAHVARKAKPVLLSTGMATLGEVESALRTVREAADPPVALFHCTSVYPAPDEEVNLRAMETLRTAFGVPVGYSDHTRGIAVSLAAVALGARLIEKHLTLDREAAGPDHVASLDPHGFGELARGIRAVEKALGSSQKQPSRSEAEIRSVARKSLVLTATLPKGTRLEPRHLIALRPGTGLSPAELPYVLGRTLARDCAEGTQLAIEHLS